jgi:hypothetical protein
MTANGSLNHLDVGATLTQRGLHRIASHQDQEWFRHCLSVPRPVAAVQLALDIKRTRCRLPTEADGSIRKKRATLEDWC